MGCFKYTIFLNVVSLLIGWTWFFGIMSHHYFSKKTISSFLPSFCLLQSMCYVGVEYAGGFMSYGIANKVIVDMYVLGYNSKDIISISRNFSHFSYQHYEYEFLVVTH